MKWKVYNFGEWEALYETRLRLLGCYRLDTYDIKDIENLEIIWGCRIIFN